MKVEQYFTDREILLSIFHLTDSEHSVNTDSFVNEQKLSLFIETQNENCIYFVSNEGKFFVSAVTKKVVN